MRNHGGAAVASTLTKEYAKGQTGNTGENVNYQTTSEVYKINFKGM